MPRLTTLLLMLILPAVACGGDTPEPVAGGPDAPGASAHPVPDAVANEVGALRGRMQRAFQDGDPAALIALFAEGKAEGVEEGFAAMRERVGGGVTPLAALYAKLDGEGGQPAVLVTGGEEPMSVTVEAAGDEAYVWLGQIAGGFRDVLLAEVWQKGPEGWRLYVLRTGTLRVAGKSGSAWYREAAELERGGQSLPAYLRLVVAADLVRPLPFVETTDAGATRDLLEAVSGKLSGAYTFPLALDDLPRTPQVLRILPAFPEGKLSPGVQYVTEHALDDAALPDEAQAVAEKLGRMFPGFCHDATHVAMAAFREVPTDPDKQYESAALVATCN